MDNTNDNTNDNTIKEPKLKIGILSTISNEWFNLHSNLIQLASTVDDADYIIYESNGDPIQIINKVKNHYPKNKLVFILSGDQCGHIDDNCIWFTNAVKPTGLASKQTQIFVTNPAIFKFYDKYIASPQQSLRPLRPLDIYFKGTIWDGMRTDMYNAFVNKPNCEIVKNNNYWKWRCESIVKPTQAELELTAFESYNDILKSKLCLCPKGNGNSSMRIIEALACGSIPVLINDFTAPFGISWGASWGASWGDGIGNELSTFCLVFDTNKHSWNYMYDECIKLINDTIRYKLMSETGQQYFKTIIYGDSKLPGFKMYSNIDTVCFGFSNMIINKLISMKKL